VQIFVDVGKFCRCDVLPVQVVHDVHDDQAWYNQEVHLERSFPAQYYKFWLESTASDGDIGVRPASFRVFSSIKTSSISALAKVDLSRFDIVRARGKNSQMAGGRASDQLHRLLLYRAFRTCLECISRLHPVQLSTTCLSCGSIG
jgi:hypothetical protein